MLTTVDGLNAETYGLLMRLRVSDARSFEKQAADRLIELGYAAISDETKKLTATAEGNAVQRITRPSK